jgi:S1-C subfamily serine protease
MVYDLQMALIHATVQLEQPQGNGTRTVGAGFLIDAPGPDGAPRIVLVTANHVFEKMPGTEAQIGYRFANADGSWTYAPANVVIRDSDGHQLWTNHPDRDIAVLSLTVPDSFVKAAIPKAWLAEPDSFDKLTVGPGDEMMALGFPRGLSANSAGFPILRAGRVASYPVAPARIYPTFLLDFSVFPGNSGGPVFLSDLPNQHGGPRPIKSVQLIAGLLTQEVQLNNERLGIGIVTHAAYIRETIDLLDAAGPNETPMNPPYAASPSTGANKDN